MAGLCMGVARLDQSQAAKVQELETQLGTPLIAVEPNCHWTDLNDEQLSRLRQAEDEIGVVLLAYKRE